MKLYQSILALLLICQSFSLADDLTLSCASPWKKRNEDGIPVYQFTGTVSTGIGWPKTTTVIDQGSFYVIKWQAKSENTVTKPICRVSIDLSSDRYGYEYGISTEWVEYTAFFYSQDASQLILSFWFDTDNDRDRIEIRKPTITKLSPEDLSKNLIPNSDFEDCGETAPFWKSTDLSVIKIEKCTDFISGEKCLTFNLDAAKKGPLSIASGYFPCEPGKNLKIKFYAKASSETILSPILQGWGPVHTGEHYFKQQRLRIDTEWKEYQFNVDIPSDTVKYPDLLRKIVWLAFQGNKDATCKIYLDEISVVID